MKILLAIVTAAMIATASTATAQGGTTPAAGDTARLNRPLFIRSDLYLRGFKGTDFTSFPSGHTTAAFAAAAAVSSETSEWWPRSRWIIGPIVYAGATLVGVSRMYDDKHWASDVAMGAAIGTFAGLKT